MFPYKEVFDLVEQSRLERSGLSLPEFEAWGMKWKELHEREFSDSDYYRKLVHIIFYAGFRAETVTDHLEIIDSYFSDYHKVADYDEESIQAIMNDTAMIRNERKIRACVKNAQVFREIVGEAGSFKGYLDSFENTECLYEDIKKRFAHMGQITSYHFLTDIGADVLKPDRVITRIFSRLGLIQNEKQIHEAVEQGKRFSEATGHPIRYIDIIFVGLSLIHI